MELEPDHKVVPHGYATRLPYLDEEAGVERAGDAVEGA